MKLRYYLRGLGIGIFVTAVIMGIALRNKSTMTDEEVKARAAELGMVEENATLKEIESSEPEIDEPTEEESSEPEESEVEESIKPETSALVENENKTITIVVRSGDSSVSVSNRLAEAGLVDSADEFDKYLCRNGYDKRISVGNYEISINASDEEIAKMITRTN